MASTKLKETDIQRAICDYLALKRIFFWRANNTPIFSDGRYRAMPKYAMKGVPDIIALKDGKFIGIEVKTKEGKLSKDQAEFGRLCVTNGGDYIVARSVDDIIAAKI